MPEQEATVRVLTDVDCPRKNYVPLRYLIVMQEKPKPAADCRFYREDPSGGKLFHFCVHPKLSRLLPKQYNSCELGIRCGDTCRFYSFGRKKRIAWVLRQKRRELVKDKKFDLYDDRFTGKGKPKMIHKVEIFHKREWKLSCYAYAWLHKLPWRQYVSKNVTHL